MTALAENPDRITDPDPATSPSVVLELTPDQVAQHPDNLRDPHRGIKELTASVAELGILVPLIVVPVDAVPRHDFDEQVTHVAVDGSRRRAAARAAGLPLPCIVRPDLASARDTAVTMAATGLARDGLTPREEAAAVQTMLDLGVTQTVIGRATGRSRKHIATAKKAATLTTDVAGSAGDYQFTLTDLATIAEFQHDEGAVRALLAAAPRGQIPHVVASLRLEQRERDIRAAAAAELTAAGVTVVDDEPTYYASTRPRDINSLRGPDTPAGEGMTPEQHQDCPGHVAHVEVMIYEPDPDDDQDDNAEQGEAVEVRITYGCTDPEQYGHQGRYGDLTPSRTPRDAGPVPAGEDDQARAEREGRQAQEKRDARRQLIQRNKDADAATQVRLAFLRESLTVKSRHKAMTGWAMLQILQRNRSFGRWIGEWSTPAVLDDILGCDRAEAVSTAASAPAVRHPIMVWAYVAAAMESEFPRDAHRQANTDRAEYLRHLAAIGYVLSDVEQLVIDNAPTANSAETEDAGKADEDGLADDTTEEVTLAGTA
ncbi:MAG TPA: ParB N-terminal domain-containing protein [Mycobacterium sp.]